MSEETACPIWGAPASEWKRAHAVTLVDSSRAGGEYWIAREAQADLAKRDEVQKARLTSWLAEQRRLGETRPVVTVEIIEDAEQRPYRVSVEGYARLAELGRTAIASSKAFVAMWFDESMDEVWRNAIKPGIEDAGYEVIRIDQKEYLNKIDDEIIAELRRARFVVAGFTHGDGGPRGGVYYEAGFAHGRSIPVIFSCRQDVIEKVHFDTRQYNHIVWEAEKPDEFRDRLTRRICAVIGDGPRGK